MSRRAALHNLGCKVNAYELDAMRRLLEESGYEIVPFGEPADVCLINTCTVTNIADRKSRQMLHRAKKQNPDAIVAAVGCYAQAKAESLLADDAVDLVIGNNHKKELVSILEAALRDREAAGRNDQPAGGAACADAGQTAGAVRVDDLRQPCVYEDLRVDAVSAHTRAFIKVQDGCNQFCSYCIIPYARGRARSRRTEDVLEELKALAASGCREIVLSGIHLSSYGLDLEKKTDLAGLAEAASEIDGIERIRLGSLEPGIVTEEFAKRLMTLPKVCPHFHLSLQSGCDRTLKRMNRHYTAEEYLEKCELLRSCFGNPALTTDVIVGFPGETEEDFRECREFLEKACLYETHIFPYSRREGTRAASFPDQLTEKVKKERAGVLKALDDRMRERYRRSFVGRAVEVLAEEQEVIDGISYWQGYTKEYQRTLIESQEDLANRIVNAVPERLEGDALIARGIFS